MRPTFGGWADLIKNLSGQFTSIFYPADPLQCISLDFFFFLDWATLTFGLSESSVSALLYFLIFLFVLPAKNFLVKGTSTFLYFFLIWKYFYQLRLGLAFQEQLLILFFIVAVLRPLWSLTVEFCFFQLIKNLAGYHWFRRILSNLNPNMSLQELEHWYQVTRAQNDQGD